MEAPTPQHNHVIHTVHPLWGGVNTDVNEKAVSRLLGSYWDRCPSSQIFLDRSQGLKSYIPLLQVQTRSNETSKFITFLGKIYPIVLFINYKTWNEKIPTSIEWIMLNVKSLYCFETWQAARQRYSLQLLCKHLKIPYFHNFHDKHYIQYVCLETFWNSGQSTPPKACHIFRLYVEGSMQSWQLQLFTSRRVTSFVH